MTFTDMMLWVWQNKTRIATELSQLFWVMYVLVLPKIYTVGIPQPWDNVCIVIATLLTAYGFGNSTVVQGTKNIARRVFGAKK